MPLGNVFLQCLGDRLMLLNYAFALKLVSNNLDFEHRSTPTAGVPDVDLLYGQRVTQLLLDGRLSFSSESPQAKRRCLLQQQLVLRLLPQDSEHHCVRRSETM